MNKKRGDYADKRGDYADKRGDYADKRGDYADKRGRLHGQWHRRNLTRLLKAKCNMRPWPKEAGESDILMMNNINKFTYWTV